MCVNAACNVGKLSALFDFAVKHLASEEMYFLCLYLSGLRHHPLLIHIFGPSDIRNTMNT